MAAMSIPKTVIKAIDRRRRAFFWTGDDKCHGSKCLVAWDMVRASKLQGRLGVKDLELQNRCLLMKFIDKLFSNEDAPWKDWIMLNLIALSLAPIAISGKLSMRSSPPIVPHPHQRSQRHLHFFLV
jgi:hypothetical protein